MFHKIKYLSLRGLRDSFRSSFFNGLAQAPSPEELFNQNYSATSNSVSMAIVVNQFSHWPPMLVGGVLVITSDTKESGDSQGALGPSFSSEAQKPKISPKQCILPDDRLFLNHYQEFLILVTGLPSPRQFHRSDATRFLPPQRAV